MGLALSSFLIAASNFRFSTFILQSYTTPALRALADGSYLRLSIAYSPFYAEPIPLPSHRASAALKIICPYPLRTAT